MGWWQALQGKVLLKYLMWRSRPGRITRYLAQKTYFQATPPVPDRVTVAAVQGELTLVSDPLDYARQMYSKVYQAAKRGAQLVVFPEDNASHLVGILPGLTGAGDVSEALGQIDPDLRVADIFNYLTPVTNSVYFTVFRYLAARFKLYIMAGSIIVSSDSGQTVNEACLFGPGGEVVGRQRKLHLLPLEVEWGLSSGEQLPVFETAVGRIAFPICMDATYFETFRIAAFNGAEAVIIPAANPDEYNFWKELRGVWPRVQESGVFGIRASMVGRIFGLTLTGRSGIFAPLELTANKDGVLAQAETPDRPEIIVADLDYRVLREYRRQNGFNRYLNKSLCQKYLPQLYGASLG